MRKLMWAIVVLGLVGCGGNPPPAVPEQADATAPAMEQTPAADATAAPSPEPVVAAPAERDVPGFVDRVWRAGEGTAVEAGTTYAFLADGTLLIESPHGTPLSGRWDYADGALTMTEEGRSYPTEIVRLDAGHFTFRSHNPGGAVDVVLLAAPDVPVPLLK